MSAVTAPATQDPAADTRPVASPARRLAPLLIFGLLALLPWRRPSACPPPG